jgi:hypothetical protein
MLAPWLLAVVASVCAQFQLAPVYSDHMVLQRNQPIVFHGSGAADAQVVVTSGGDGFTTQSDESGNWRIELPPQTANAEPQSFAFRCADQDVQLNDVLIGDLWICAGQSNMEFQLRSDRDRASVLGGPDQPMIRLFQAQYTATGAGGKWKADLADGMRLDRFMSGSWSHANAEALPSMSAVGYYFGAALHQEVGVPIGLIDVAAGGTPTEAWISPITLRSDARTTAWMKGDWLQQPWWGEWCRQRAAQNLSGLLAAGVDVPGDSLGPNHAFKPGFLWQAAVAPFTRMAVRGVIWYQGESNAESPERVRQHGIFFPMLVQSWRDAWKQPELPFLYVQLPAMNRPDWPAFREQQRHFLTELAKVGMAVTIDVGDAKDVHPRIKKPVGERLAKLALQVAYGLLQPGQGPRPLRAAVEADHIRISFDCSGELALIAGTQIQGFEFVDADGNRIPVQPKLDGVHLLLPFPARIHPPAHSLTNPTANPTANSVANLVAVRYAWDPVPQYCLTDQTQIPATPFELPLQHALVKNGKAVAVRANGKAWTSTTNGLTAKGTGKLLQSDFMLGSGESWMELELKLTELDSTAASLQINGSHVLFDAKGGRLATEGPLFGSQLRFLPHAPIAADQFFQLHLHRLGGELRIELNGVQVAVGKMPANQVVESIALRPHRGEWSVRSWTASGDLRQRPQAMDGVTVFESGDHGYHTFRIPAIVQAANGDLLAFAEGRRHSSSDSGDIDLVMRRSRDGGQTWQPLQLIADNERGVYGNPSPIVDQASGAVLLLTVRQDPDCHESQIRSGEKGGRTPCVMRSDDHGKSWSEPESLYKSADRKEWAWYATGPCHAIQLKHGRHAGRIVIPANHSVLKLGAGNQALGAHLLLSDDLGSTWRIGAVANGHLGDNLINPSETAVTELADGRLYLNTRDQHGSSKSTRAHTWSTDGGETLRPVFHEVDSLPAPVCQAALLTVGNHLLFSAPSHPSQRQRLAIRSSNDGGVSWKEAVLVDPGFAAYSDLVQMADDQFGVLYEVNGYGAIRFTPFWWRP